MNGSTGGHRTHGRTDPLLTISLNTSANETSITYSSGEVFKRATAKELGKSGLKTAVEASGR